MKLRLAIALFIGVLMSIVVALDTNTERWASAQDPSGTVPFLPPAAPELESLKFDGSYSIYPGGFSWTLDISEFTLSDQIEITLDDGVAFTLDAPGGLFDGPNGQFISIPIQLVGSGVIEGFNDSDIGIGYVLDKSSGVGYITMDVGGGPLSATLRMRTEPLLPSDVGDGLRARVLGFDLVIGPVPGSDWLRGMARIVIEASGSTVPIQYEFVTELVALSGAVARPELGSMILSDPILALTLDASPLSDVGPTLRFDLLAGASPERTYAGSALAQGPYGPLMPIDESGRGGNPVSIEATLQWGSNFIGVFRPQTLLLDPEIDGETRNTGAPAGDVAGVDVGVSGNGEDGDSWLNWWVVLALVAAISGVAALIMVSQIRRRQTA